MPSNRERLFVPTIGLDVRCINSEFSQNSQTSLYKHELFSFAVSFQTG